MNIYNDKFIITGGRELDGEVTIQSAKNSVLPILAGCVLCDKAIQINNIPNILDVHNMLDILRTLGVEIKNNNKDYIIDASNLKSFTLNQDLCKTLRSSIFLLGPLVARFKKATISYPGGCDIGNRPIDVHIDAPDVWCFFNIKSAVK